MSGRHGSVRPPLTNRYVGFAGCPAAQRLIRIEPAPGHRPALLTVDCPACGARHVIRPSWRRLARGEEPRRPDLILTAD